MTSNPAPSGAIALLRTIATHADDAAAWQRIGHGAERVACDEYRRVGRVMPQLDGLLCVPPAALPALAPATEIDATDPDDLARSLRGAWALLDETWPAAGRETRFFVRAVASGRLPPGRQCSGSSERHPCAIRIDFCRDDPAHMLADAIVHEASHVKLRLARVLPRLCEPDDLPRLHHPWRSELRPLSAVLLACHAFVGVHGFHARRRALGGGDAAPIEATLRGEVDQGLDTLAGDAGLTAEGRYFTALLRSAFDTHCQLADTGPHAP